MNLFRRLRRLVSGLAGLLITSVEQQNPEALLDAAKQDFLAKVAQYNQALVQLASVAERIKTHLQSKTSRAMELERRIIANHKSGNIDLAGSLARELQEIQKDIQQSAQELKETEAAYENNIANAKLARRESATVRAPDQPRQDEGSGGRSRCSAERCNVQGRRHGRYAAQHPGNPG